jgi:hypothetical protein
MLGGEAQGRGILAVTGGKIVPSVTAIPLTSKNARSRVAVIRLGVVYSVSFLPGSGFGNT